MEKNIISFSGGKDSTAMLLLMIEKKMNVDEIIFIDTRKEFPDMYEHIDKVKDYIGMPITILKPKKDFDYYMFEHIKTKGKRKGEKGYGWPDMRNRWCTQILKKSIVKEYIAKFKNYKIIEYHGIAVDEINRSNKNKEKNIRYPLIEWGMTERDCLNYCYSKGFNWNGLYERFKRVSCWCCPLKSLNELKILYKYYPDLWDKLCKMNKMSKNEFRKDYTIEQLERRFKKEIWWKNHQINFLNF